MRRRIAQRESGGLTIALYPGSFDPITNGHVDIAARAAAIFDKVVVAVYDTPAKSLLFSTEERTSLARTALAGVTNVSVMAFQGLAVRTAVDVGAKVIVRGVRALSDFEAETQLDHLYRRMEPNVDVCLLITSLPYSYLSASMIKEIARLGGDIGGMVPPHVADALGRKYSGGGQPNDPPKHLGN